MDEKKESASGVTQRIYEANVLFGVAVNSAASIQAPVRAGGQLHALVSLVFSVIAVEALLNEATEMAGRFSKYAGNLKWFQFLRSAWPKLKRLMNLSNPNWPLHTRF